MKIIIREYIPAFVEVGDYKPRDLEFDSPRDLHIFLKKTYPGFKFSSHGRAILAVKNNANHLCTLIKGDVGELREELEHDIN